MPNSVNSLNNPARLAALSRSHLLDTAHEENFDRLTRMAAAWLDAPISVMTLIEEKRQFFKSAFGMSGWPAEARSTDIKYSFCQYVVTSGAPFIVEDSKSHPVVKDNPGYTEFNIQAYLGVPIHSPDGYTLGSLCVADNVPRTWTETQVQLMRELSELVSTQIRLEDEARRRRAAELVLRKDLQQHEQTLAALAESEQRFRHTFDYAGNGMAIVGLNGRWIRVNKVLCDIVGYSEAELLTKTFQDLTHPDDLNTDLEHVRELLEGKRASYQMEKRYIRKNKNVVWIRLTASLVRNKDGSPAHFVSQIEDISERRRLESQLADALKHAVDTSRLKSDFLANMSHEIRTPMNGVIGMTTLLLHTQQTPEQRKMTEVIQRSGEALLNIINDILDISKIEAGKMRIDPTDFSLKQCVDETIVLLAPRAEEKSLRLITRFDPALAELNVVGDPGRIRQILTNLVGNAIKFTSAGSVTVSVRRLTSAADQVSFRIEVVDTGSGISPAAQKNLFQPFEQGEQGTNRKFGGTGLGLTISQQLVHLMGGNIGFSSKEGAGSTFWFELTLFHSISPAPTSPTSFESSSAAEEGTNDPHGRKLKLLLADDNTTNQLVALAFLEKLGHKVTVVGDGKQALAALERERFDAVFMDCQMPELDGYETTRQIRAGMTGETNRHVPIIALTAYAMASDRAKCLEAGMNEYISKPLRMDEVGAAIERAMKTERPIEGDDSSSDDNDETPILDTASLEQLRGIVTDGVPMLAQIMRMFREDAPKRMAQIEIALQAGHIDRVLKEAHRLNGSSGAIGGMRVRAAAVTVEDLAHKGDVAALPRTITKLKGELDRLFSALDKFGA